jgi:tetratricopeptide (TPR) repeat protein
LSDKLKARCEALDLFIWQQGDYQLILLKKGFRNAVALFPQQKIFIGIDLLEHLSEEETRAIALHEIGHLQDKKYVPLRHRISQILPFLIVAFIIADQGNLFPSFLFQTAVFFAGLILFSQLFKRLRLKGEFVADTYVKDFPGDFHSHLISGIKKITRLNGLDKDFCKTHNYAHLDVDEREQMVKDGNFSLQRKPIRKFFFILIPAMVFGVLFQFGWSAIFPSKSKQWQTLHKLYHAQTSRYEFALAAETIHKCFDFSLKNYGEIDRRTYISLKHLATTSIREKDFSTAEQYIIRAGHIGEELYGSESLRRNGERKLLARILIKESRKEEAKQVYTTILSLQQKLKDTPWKISRTLYALAELSDVQQKIDYYQEIILLYKNSEPGADNSPSEYIFSDLAEAYIQSGQPQKATSLLAEAVPVIRDKKGTNSEEYGNILWEFANLLSDQKHFKKAETAYQQCLTATSEMEPYISIGCRYDAGENFRRQGLLAQAQQQTLLALNREEELYGRDSEEILFGLNKLAQLAEQSGNAAEAQALQRRASTINEKTK